MSNFQGKSVLVLGGSRGIGKIIARQLAEEGADWMASFRTRLLREIG